MENNAILIVDDEKNIRLTLTRALEPLGTPLETAVNGEDALQKLQNGDYGLVFLDLRMPGMEGMEVLRQIKKSWPAIRVVIITAHGTVHTAIEAMKLGAADFLQKPFSPREIRKTATAVMQRGSLDQERAAGYGALIQQVKGQISNHLFDRARTTAQQAIAADPTRPEAYNLLGAVLEIKGDALDAQRFYRVAIEIDPTFKPAIANLERTTSTNKFGGIDIGTQE